MVNLIRDNIHELQKICKIHHVKSMYLFGSATNSSEFNINSDIDFLYRVSKSEIPETDYADNYFNLLFTLEDLLKRNVDLVPEEKLNNPYLIHMCD